MRRGGEGEGRRVDSWKRETEEKDLNSGRLDGRRCGWEVRE